LNREATLYSERLELRHISSDELIALAEQPDSFFLYKLRAPFVIENEENNKWLFRNMFLKNTDERVGQMSFHLPPDENGMVEVGLDVEEMYRGNGFATEALKTFWLWACEQPEVKLLRYTVSATNHPSMRIIQRFGFTHVGQQQDDVDGPEEIFEMSCEEFKSRFSQT
jgi:RimJ/RimL family protein N-acetyltransferase